MRARLRSFDPIVRFGGDEFVCGLGGADLAEARRRFHAIGVAIEKDAGVGISVGFAVLEPGDTADALTERADADMIQVRAARRLASARRAARRRTRGTGVRKVGGRAQGGRGSATQPMRRGVDPSPRTDRLRRGLARSRGLAAHQSSAKCASSPRACHDGPSSRPGSPMSPPAWTRGVVRSAAVGEVG